MQPFATHRHFKEENAGGLNQARGAIEVHRRLPTLLGEGGSAQSRIAGRWAMPWTGKNGRYAVGMLRQSAFGRLAGCEDVNEVVRHDPAMRFVRGVPFGPMDRRVADMSWQ